MPIFFIPARGRKLRGFARNTSERLIFFIPARGRKHLNFNFYQIAFWIFFIPARGRKRFHSYFKFFLVIDDFLYPREGTETAFSQLPIGNML